MKIIITPIIVASLMLIIFFSTQTPTISDFQDQQNKADFSFNKVTISVLKMGDYTGDWDIHSLCPKDVALLIGLGRVDQVGL